MPRRGWRRSSRTRRADGPKPLSDRSFLRGMVAGALITLGASAGVGLVALMLRDYLQQEKQARAAAALEPDPAVETGAPGDLLYELTRARRGGAKAAGEGGAPPRARGAP